MRKRLWENSRAYITHLFVVASEEHVYYTRSIRREIGWIWRIGVSAGTDRFGSYFRTYEIWSRVMHCFYITLHLLCSLDTRLIRALYPSHDEFFNLIIKNLFVWRVHTFSNLYPSSFQSKYYYEFLLLSPIFSLKKIEIVMKLNLKKSRSALNFSRNKKNLIFD